MSFVHFHTHSEFSLLESSLRLKAAVKKASEDGQAALALTDHGNLFGAIEFYFACLDKKIKPILGLEVYLTSSRHVKAQDRNEVQSPLQRLVLIAENLAGYRNLCKLSTIGYQEGFYYKPRIDDECLQLHNQNLFCLTGGERGEIAQLFLKSGAEAAKARLRQLQEFFPDRLYVELTRTTERSARGSALDQFLIDTAREFQLPLIATNDVHYLSRDDQMVQEVLICIGTNKTLQDESRFRLGSEQFYLKSQAEMAELFRDIPEALQSTLELAEKCNVKFKVKDDQGKPIYHLPSFPTQGGRSVFEEIASESRQGLDRRLQENFSEISEELRESYFQRLQFELGVINRMGFNGYFLIVADFINWAKSQNIPVGPGRGSGAGSLVAYSLRITDLDPIKYNLLFERFLNPERISMPDFDIDFCQDRRGEVIDYVTQKYGAQSVSQIITFGKLQAKAAIKDVGRVLGMTFAEVDVVSKLIPEKPGTTLAMALEQEPRLLEAMEADPQIGTLVGLAKQVEGLNRHAGIHAAGVIIADGNLLDHAPLYRGAEGESVVQYDMKHAEKVGLIKFDFLGLKTLTHIRRACDLIRKNRGEELAPESISVEDPRIYEVMSRGDTAGVFQFEGEGITDAIRKIKPSSFFDITAINALYRPGPMAMIPDFAKRKNKEEPVTYLFDELREILEETYGIIVYQEQVMAIASRIAGYSLGEADMLRRAMGKKIKEEMDQHRDKFMKGALGSGFDEKKSAELFELMYKFADYGFNKSHAAAYCVIAAQTAYLKNRYPAEFFAALLSTELGDTDKVVKYSKDAQKRGLFIKPPNVNYSDFLFSVHGDEVFFGLGGIKGVGESAVTAILEARSQQPTQKFTSLENFFEKVDSRKLNKKVIECLIKAGAFDEFGHHRAQVMASYTRFLNRAEEVRKEAEVGQGSLFDLGNSEENSVKLEVVKPWSRTELLALEKEVLGFYLSDHPLKGFETIASLWTECEIQKLPEVFQAHEASRVSSQDHKKYDFRNRDGHKKRVVVSGLIVECREVITKKGTRMAFGKLEDLTGSVELVLFPDVFATVAPLLKADVPLLVGGFLEGENGQTKIMVDSMIPLQETLKRTKKVTLRLDLLEDNQVLQLSEILKSHPGGTPVELVMRLPEFKKDVVIEGETEMKVLVGPELLENLQTQFGQTQFVEMRL